MQQASRISQRTAFFLDGELIEYSSTKDMFLNPQLQDGAHTLKDGMQEFDEQGTRKLKDTVEKEFGVEPYAKSI